MTVSNKPMTPEFYPTAVDIWARAVKATHHFLTEEDFNALHEEIPSYFAQVDAQLWYDGDALIGFSGIYDQSLEMLFIDPVHFKKGYGTQIIQRLFEDKHITTVDVNEDNPNAVKFYHKQGFEQVSRSETDGEGRPYPILHLALPEAK